MKNNNKIFALVFIGMLFVVFSQPVLAAKGKININTATKKELVTIKYIGDKIADRIIEYREANPFEKTEDIMNIKGVGEKSI